MAFLSLIPAGVQRLSGCLGAVFLLHSAMVKGLALTFFFVVVIGLIDNILPHCWWGKTPDADYLILISDPSAAWKSTGLMAS